MRSWRFKRTITILLLLCLFLLLPEKSRGSEELLVYCGAGLSEALTEIAEEYREQTGTEVRFKFNGSGALLNQLKLTRKGDLYLPGDAWFLGEAEKLVVEKKLFARHIPVIAVPEGNPGEVETLADLLASEVKLILGDDNIAVGRASRNIFSALEENSEIPPGTVRAGTVNQIVSSLELRQAEAGIIWQPNYYQNRGELEMLEIPEEVNDVRPLEAGLLEFSRNKERARDFMNFLERPLAREIFKNYGYDIPEREEEN